MVQNKVIKTKKTEVVKRNENPEFNESFTFKLPLSSLDTANVTVTAMQHQSGYKGKKHYLHNDCNNVGQVCNPHEHPIPG